MWVNTIKHGSKTLSPVELLVLTSVPASYLDAKELLSKLNTDTRHWEPERGSIYPILHRLEKRGLLQKESQERMSFRRTASGSKLLIDSLDPIVVQFEASVSYFESITENLLKGDPIGTRKILVGLQVETKKLLNILQVLEEKSRKIETDDGWQQVEIE